MLIFSTATVGVTGGLAGWSDQPGERCKESRREKVSHGKLKLELPSCLDQ